MNTILRFRVKKEVDTPTARKILSLKGSLIAQCYTDIIHFDDEDEHFYMHYFSVETARRKEAADYIAGCIREELLSDIVMLVEK
ncbi:hypothetical protein FUA48_09930 [Flavobacterium alkalisoli]|uniref:Uncharacterized protein n=1 Tax=Flavobacterium alkalisoli TaxID=2602769 RepID=A0A5B9FYQ7_9FLAO|nr:hypothetical protein [Flavobacterium alkalisoli]QEE49887.1 hypothetical protein FUA48_09930 [Flavobacterium alkalisoli]